LVPFSALFIMSDEKHIYHKLDDDGNIRAIDMYTGEVVSLAEHEVLGRSYKYTLNWGDAICEAIRQGMTMKKIGDHPKYPPLSVIYTWRDRHPDFKERMKAAKQDRAEFHRDRALEIAEETESKEEAHVNRLKVDTHKWAASKDDPARYENNIKVEQHHTGQVGFFALRTGVPRSEGEKELTEGRDGLTIEGNCKTEPEQREDS